MKLFCLSAVALGVAAKDIKQKMMENRLKFDRDVVIHGGDEGDDEEWDPWDLEDEELQVNYLIHSQIHLQIMQINESQSSRFSA